MSWAGQGHRGKWPGRAGRTRGPVRVVRAGLGAEQQPEGWLWELLLATGAEVFLETGRRGPSASSMLAEVVAW